MCYMCSLAPSVTVIAQGLTTLNLGHGIATFIPSQVTSESLPLQGTSKASLQLCSKPGPYDCEPKDKMDLQNTEDAD